MAANLAGMFQQMNQAIQANPMGQPTNASMPGMVPRPQDTLNPLLQRGLMKGMGAVGSEGDYSTSQQAMQGVAEGMGKLDLTTSQGLLEASKLFGAVGIPDKQAQLAQAGAAKAQEELALKRQQMRREALVSRANDLGMTGLAKEVASGAADVDEASKTLNKLEIAGFDIPARLSLAKSMNITEKEFFRDGLGKASNEVFDSFVNGRKGKPMAYSKGGENFVFITNEATGKVFDPETRTYKNPSDLGLKPEVRLSRVENIDNGFASDITGGVAKGFLEQWDNAKSGVTSLDANTEALDMLNQGGLTTGSLANARIGLGKFAVLLGMDSKFTDDVERTTAYLAMRGRQVGEVIKMFGSGTGLSDADAIRAESIAAGNEGQTPGAIKMLLELERKYILKGLSDYEASYANVEKNNTSGAITPMSMDLLKLPEPLRGRDPAPEFNAPPVTKVLDGVTYVQRDGTWYPQ